MEEKAKVLREVDQTVSLTGYLKEKNLTLSQVEMDFKDAKGQVTEKGVKVDSIYGYIVVSANGKDVKVNLKQKEKTNSGKQNKIYAGLVTIMNDYVSEADVLDKYKNMGEEDLPENWRDEVDVVTTKGTFDESAFLADGGNFVLNEMIKGSFVNRVTKNRAETKHEAKFKVEGYFNKITEEFDKEGLETGRLRVELILTKFNGQVIPIEFIAQKGNVANYLRDNYVVGKTGEVWGEVDFTQTVKEVVTEGFGESNVDIITSSKKELIITGGKTAQYDENSDKSLDRELIKKAMVERKNYHEKVKAGEFSNRGSSKPSGTTSKYASKTPSFVDDFSASSSFVSVEDFDDEFDDDIPF